MKKQNQKRTKREEYLLHALELREKVGYNDCLIDVVKILIKEAKIIEKDKSLKGLIILKTLSDILNKLKVLEKQNNKK